MTEQLVFDLPCRTARGREDFFVSTANADVLKLIDGWQGWIDGKLVLCGPHGAGKTHLASVWAEASGARIVSAGDLHNRDVPGLAAIGAVAVEDADRLAAMDSEHRAAAERAMFHLHNLLRAEGGALLVTGCEAPSRWDIALPDLASRLRAAQTATLPAPDDQLLAAVLVKLFDDRQLLPTPDAVRLLVSRMDRSLAAAAQLVEVLDRASMRKKQAVTRSLVSDILAANRSPD